MNDWLSITWGDEQSQDGKIVSGHKVITDKAIKRKIKNDQLHLKKANSLDQLCQHPLKGEHYRIITEKAFNAYALILSVLKRTNIEEMYLAIYRINQPTVESIIDFIEQGKIKIATFVISNFFNQTKKPERWAMMLRDYAETKKMSSTYTFIIMQRSWR
jgi:DNA-binding protein Fis